MAWSRPQAIDTERRLAAHPSAGELDVPRGYDKGMTRGRPLRGRARLQWAWAGRRGWKAGSLPVLEEPIVFGGRRGQFRIDGYSASKVLGQIVRVDGAIWVEQLDGNAAIRVNGDPVVREELRNGDQIEVGDVPFTIWDD